MNWVRVFRKSKSIPIPTKATEGSSGFDLVANIERPVELLPFVPVKILTGIHLQLDAGIEAQIRPRSSYSAKGILCSFGTIDSDYRGEIAAVLTNLTKEPYCVLPGDRIAQLVFSPVLQTVCTEAESLEDLNVTERGESGWGSSGR